MRRETLAPPKSPRNTFARLPRLRLPLLPFRQGRQANLSFEKVAQINEEIESGDAFPGQAW